MKIVLLAVNAKYVHSALAVWLLAAGVREFAKTPWEAHVIESTIQQSDADIAKQIAAHNPDAIGISTYIWNAAKLPGLIFLLREQLPDAVIILGGPEASHNAEYWLAIGAGHIIRGAGERALPELLDGLANPPGAVAPPLLIGGAWGEWSDPYTPEYLAALHGRIAYLETSRGCPYRCAFCLSAGSGVINLPLQDAKERLRKLSRSGAKTVKLVDRTFNCDRERAYDLFEYIMQLDTPCRFHFEVAADLFDARTLALLEAAPPGRIQLETGLQSYHDLTLKAITRKSNLQEAEANIRALLRPGNIHMHADLIAGLPHETMDTFAEGFDRAYTLGAHTLQLGFLKLLHGSALREQAGTLGIQHSQEPPYEIISTPWMSADDLRIVKQAENALRHTYNQCRFQAALRYVLAATHMRPFALYRAMGEAVPNHGIALDDYAERLAGVWLALPNTKEEALRDAMLFDWLGMVKGKNRPPFLKQPGRRHEAAVLSTGRTIAVDVKDRDPVTGLYRVIHDPSPPG
jgi:hypothetical protein